MVNIVKHDLEFILKQIKIAEAHSSGTPLDQIYVNAQGDVVDANTPGAVLAISHPLAPYGLRTVDGSYNNMVAGREQWGAADREFPRLTDPAYRTESDDSITFGAGSPGQVVFTDGDYSQMGAPSPASMGLGGGTVVDADPRIISNLIVDQTLDNPAAIYAALVYSGHSGAALRTALEAIVTAHANVKAGVSGAETVLEAALTTYGVEMEGNSVIIPNVSPDEGLSAPYNSWLTLFGQFFDHGLDLVQKGNNGTIYIPLQPDDPLYNPATPHTNFMVLTRTTPDAPNLTTPWVDQNQTYSSSASKQLFMREYDFSGDAPQATGKLLSGDRGLATWGDVKAQALQLGFALSDSDVGNIPLFAMDEYGEFIRGPNGYPQIVMNLGADGKFGGTAANADILVEGNPASPVSTAGAVRTGHAFIDDIAHAAALVNSRGQVMFSDGDNAAGLDATPVGNPSFSAAGDMASEPYPALNPAYDPQNPAANPRYIAGNLPYLATNSAFDPAQPESATNPRYVQSATPSLGINGDYDENRPESSTNPRFVALNRLYDDELLDAHYVTGDGRGNENIGLSAVHHVFHSEHNHMVDQVKQRAIEANDRDFLNEWLATDLTQPEFDALPDTLPTTAEGWATLFEAFNWDGERLFQAARFTTEMQYQHLVFEEFARKIQPDVDAFVFNPSTDIDPAIFAEFAHVVYRFGHSMLREEVALTNADGGDESLTLFSAFLNPLAFGSDTISHDVATGAIVRGMTSQVGNEIDEFVTDVLRNQLLGIPLDLAAINIARGRDTGIPSLNEARAQFQVIANGDTQLDPYKSWVDFGLNLKNPASIVNFIAAYGTHQTVANATTAEAKRDAAMKLVFGGADAPADRLDFLNARGIYAGGKLGGLNDIDLWVGGLAEKKMAFGGMLGSTFSFIFELQMENLQNADRFYYLSRVQGLNFLNELENNSFAKMILNNTDLGETGYALPGDVFSVPDHVLYMDHVMQNRFGLEDPQQQDMFLEQLSPMVERRDAAGNLINPVDDPNAVASYIRVNTNDHVLIQGTNNNDIIIAGGGDDSVWGRGGNDRIEAGYGVDKIHGGDGDDIITNNGTDIGEVDMLHGEAGNDVIHGGSGLALIFGNEGKDVIITGPDGKEAFGGLDDDFILGGEGADFLLGNEGDDWIEGGGGFDTTAGDNSELFFNSTIIGHDVMFAGTDEHDFDAESGDDIMVQGESVMRNEGMLGFDWAIHKGNAQAADSDLLVPIFTTDQQDILRDRFDAVEALSGWDKNDSLKGDDRADPAVGGVGGGLAGAENTMVGHELSQEGVNRIAGLRQVLGNWVAAAPAGSTAAEREQIVAFDDGNILLGGGGSDTIEGRGGNDVIDGDAWLNVRIAIRDTNGVEIGWADGLAKPIEVTQAGRNLGYQDWAGKQLHTLMLSGEINPVQLNIVREIKTTNNEGDTDTAVFSDNFANYTITRDTDGSVLVSHNTVTVGLTSDGTDKLRNIEQLQFADRLISLIPPEIELNGFDTVTRSWGDNFNTRAYTNNAAGTTNSFDGAWVEAGDGAAGSPTTGSVQITAGGTLTFSTGNADDASVTRNFNLQGATSATVSFSISDNNVAPFPLIPILGDDEQIFFEFAADGVNFVTLQTFDGSNGGNVSFTLPTNVAFGTNAAIRFRANNTLDNNESFSIDNLSITAVFQQPANAPSVDITASYTEGAAATPIASEPRITDDGATIASARIVLTNMFAGDTLSVPAALLNGNGPIAATSQVVGSTIVVTLAGVAPLAAYQAAIQSIGFGNTSDNPSTTPRIIEVTVNDGILDSSVARATINVTAVNDPVDAVADSVITNAQTLPVTLPEWALLANDVDPDSTITISGNSAGNGIGVTRGNGVVSINSDTGAAGGSFTYTASDGATSETVTVNVQRQTAININGGTGGEIIVGDGRNSTIDAGTGNDIVFAGAGDDIIVWNANVVGATDGRDFVDGGAGTDDTFIVNGNGTAEAFVVYSAAAAAANGITGLRPGTEIVITRNGAVIAELHGIEEITINTGAGNDTVGTVGDFSPTSLNFNTITINGDGGNDTVDLSALASAHRIVFRSNGGQDTIIGALRPQDVIELAQGTSLDDYTATNNGNGTTTLSNGTHSITFASSGMPQIREEGVGGLRGAFELSQSDVDGLKKLINGQRPFADEDDADHALGVRTLSGAGNNEDNPHWGAADTPFIRLTEARYGDYDAEINNRELNPIYEGLDPRAISNILGAQEAGLPHATNNANIFFMTFGQYFDHGLDFIPKNAVNGTVQIGAPGIGQPGQGNPADLTRGEVFAIDDEGVPQHLNKTSTFVDQNQAYGSHNLVGQFLREGDGQGGLGSHLLKGAPDPSNPTLSLLPTLREAIQHHWDNNTIFTDPSLPGGQIAFRTYYSNYPVSETTTGTLIGPDGTFDPQVYGKLASNFMGSGHALLLDTNPFISLLDHYVAGDGRANENFTLTSMHTIWARNHNFHVENLLASGFTGTEQELFEAAKVLNEAEYQRVVFTEFADALIGGIRGDGDHGNNGYNPDADPGISHEFAAAVYRVGHSLIGQTITVMDANGQPKQVALFDAFLNPTNDADAFTTPLDQLAQRGYVPQPGYEQYGVNGVLEGISRQPAEQVDFNIVDAVRNDLVRIQADLFSFNVARGRDVGLGTLNQIRKDLDASQNSYVKEAVGYAGNMSAYASWEDFQQRNGLSDAVIAQFKQAYPDLVLDTPEKLAAFVAANPDIQLVNGNTVKGIDRVDLWVGGLAEKHINGGMVGQTFWVVLHEQFDRLQEADRFYYKDRLEAFDFYEEFIDGQEFSDIIARNTGLTDLPEHIFEVNDEDGEGDGNGQGDDDEDDDDDTPTNPGDDEDDDDEDPVGSGDDDDEDDDEEEDDEDDDDDTPAGGDDDDDEDDPSCGCDDDDDEGPGTPAPNPNPGAGGALRTGTAAADVLIGTAGADNIVGLAGDDTITGDAGADAISAGDGADFIDAGDGRDVVFAGAGDDQVFGGGGVDMLYGEAGNDRIFGGAGNDLIDAGAGKDTVVAGAGDDRIIGAAGDDDDTYFGDEVDGGNGSDTLDFATITANLTVDLGNGLNGRGSAISSQTGTDTLWSIENVATGSGNDTITASDAVNVMEGGSGNDTFRFLSAAGADGDTILDFQPGDRLDLSAIDADASQAGNQSFTLASGASFTASAQLTVTYETRADGDYTIVKGNVDAATDAEFQINLKGSHNLTASSFIV